MNKSRNRNILSMRAEQRGIAIAEFTIVLPLILFLILGVSEFGRGFMQYNQLTRAVRDGARHAANEALFGQTQVVNLTAQLLTETTNLVVYGNTAGSGASALPGLSPADVTVNDEGGGNISVTASYAYQPIIAPLIPAMLQSKTHGGAFNMQAQVVMRAL